MNAIFILDHLFSISLRPVGEFASLFFLNELIFQIDLYRGSFLAIDLKGEPPRLALAALNSYGRNIRNAKNRSVYNYRC
ncbi:MAG TPA: hypothetical protein VGA95_13540 [Thermodesulfobacteriota bacterium]